jgi:hypothetical protein
MYSKFLLVVLGMGADPFDNDQTTQIANLDYQPIPVALDIEDHPVAGQKVGAAVTLFDVLRCLPLAALDFVLPCIQRPPGIGMGLLEPLKKWQAEYSHGGTGEGSR